MTTKTDRLGSAQTAYNQASSHFQLGFEQTSTVEGCLSYINKVSAGGGLACHCNLTQKDVQVLQESPFNFKVKNSSCLNPYTDTKDPCYTVFWHRPY